MRRKHPKRTNRLPISSEDKLAAYELRLYEEALNLDKKRRVSYIE